MLPPKNKRMIRELAEQALRGRVDADQVEAVLKHGFRELELSKAEEVRKVVPERLAKKRQVDSTDPEGGQAKQAEGVSRAAGSCTPSLRAPGAEATRGNCRIPANRCPGTTMLP